VVPRGTVGILYPGMEARIIRDDGREANVNEPGELYIRGPNIVSGYWRNEEATRSTFLSDGWLRTGDRFRIDEHGYFL
jgi:long-subunit acyl-CoA synthetase (AMP-forming)